MKTRGYVATLAIASVIGAAALTACGTASTAFGGSSTKARAAVCAGLDSCRLVATKDVSGDGRADEIGWRQLGDRAVQIRVRTAPGHVLTARVDVRLWWGGGAWGGATHVDRARGVELLVGSMQGAHTPMYTMLTYRSGRLVVEDSPSRLSPLWQVDAADGDYMGWWRHTLPNGQIAMTQKIAVRVGVSKHFSGHNVTYVWQDGGWHRTTSRAMTYANGQVASRIAGFHVSGLKAFPGVG